MKKIFIRLILTMFVFSAMLIFAGAAEPIYSYKEEIPVSDSITLVKVEEFYADHNLSYSYIKADLSNENTSLELLTSDKGTDIIENMATLAATNKHTVAALNGDFYSVHTGVKGFSLGAQIKNGEIMQSPINPDTMATVSYVDGIVTMGYPEFRISLTAPNGESADVRHLNKHTNYYGDILMYTSDFNGGMSPAPGADVVEVVVSDGKVVEKRYGQPPVEIPEDGYVLAVADSSNPFFLKNISVDDEIKIEYQILPELKDGQTSFGGGAMLIKDGEIVSEFSHVVSGRHPRSAVGMDESGKTLYLVAVNGRQDNSRGLTMTELAELMLKLGCYNAVNLDGGGSTHMTASTVWNGNMHTVNTPTENRRVINAVGLLYKTEEQRAAEEAEKSKEKDETVDDNINEDTKTEETEKLLVEEPEGILIKSDKNAVFVGHSVNITVAAYDENMRPVDCEIDISSAFGTVDNGIFTPEVSGWTTVEAMCGDAYASIEIYVVEAVSGIDTTSHIRLENGQSTELEINVFDNLGNYVEITDISSFELYSSNPEVVSVDGKTLTALSEGTSIVTIQKEGVQTNISVAVGRETKSYTDNFEFVSGKFKPYPLDVEGAFEYVRVPELSDSKIGKLSWDFTEEENAAAEVSEESSQQIEIETEIEAIGEAETNETVSETIEESKVQPIAEEIGKKQEVAMGVYLTFDEKMQLADTEDTISLDFYSEKEFAHTLKAQFIDATGNISIVSFGEEYSVGEWQTLTAQVPETAVRPLKLDSIYAVYIPGENAVRDAGCVYLDNLSFNVSVPVKFEAAEANAYAVEEGTEETEQKFAAGFYVKDNKNSIYADFVNYFTEEKMSSYSNRIMLGNGTSLSSKEDDNALYITLDTSKGGIRNTNSAQWSKLKELSETTEKKNIFIISDDSLFGTSDFENRVLTDYLASLDKNVFVITGGNRNTYKNINGVKYFTLGNDLSETVTLTHLTNYTFLEFDFGKENVTFTWETAVERI